MRYILGVDGGGSKTYAVVVDEAGNKLGDGMSSCGNHQLTGISVALQNIQKAIDDALAQARLSAADIHFVQYGLAGADRERDFAILRPALATLPFAAWDVVCDTMEGLRTGSPRNVGVVLVCGSGTNAMGRSASGKMIQTGGFDHRFGDATGGYFLGVETFRAAIRSWEFREPWSVLQEMVAAYLGFPDMEAVLNHYLDNDIEEIPAQLTLVLHEAAAKNDKLAIKLLQAAGRELGLSANSVIRRLGGLGVETIPIVVVGSVVQKGRSPVLLEALVSTVKQENPNMELIIPEMAPVYGTVLLGMDHLGISTPEDLMKRFITYGGYAD